MKNFYAGLGDWKIRSIMLSRQILGQFGLYRPKQKQKQPPPNKTQTEGENSPQSCQLKHISSFPAQQAAKLE